MEQAVWIIAAVAIAIVLALLIRRFVAYVAVVSSHSMVPTLLEGQRLLAARVYRYDRIMRGDILLVHSRELGQDIVKRVIGLPGDAVEITGDGAVSVNGEPLREPYVRHAGGLGGTYPVGAGSYLLLGDSRAQSNDSRHWRTPTIPQRDIRGKALLRLTPPGRL